MDNKEEENKRSAQKVISKPYNKFFRNAITVRFRLNCTSTRVGQIISVTGSISELGNWNPRKGIVLQTSPQDFPIWKGGIQVEKDSLANPNTIEYKYVIIDENPKSNFSYWEPLGGNRVIDLRDVDEVEEEDIFGKPIHIKEELKLRQQITVEPVPGEEISSEFSTSSPAFNKKVIKKVREIKYVNEQYQQTKKKNINQRSGTKLTFGHEELKTVEEEGNHSYEYNELANIKQRMSEETIDVDDHNQITRNLEDLEQQRKQSIRQNRYNMVNDLLNSGTDQQSSTGSILIGRKMIKSPQMPEQLKIIQQVQQTGATGGVISSDEDDDKLEDEDDDEDMIEEEKKLLEDIKISADDIVIVASFKLPIAVDRDPTSPAGWKVRASRSLLYPTLFKLREKKKMVKIQWIGWPGVIAQNEKEQQEITDFLRDYGCVPVFFDSDTVEKFLYFHETVLRPLFHNFKGLNDFEYDLGKQELWQKYQTVNQKFASMITELKQEREMIWIHDNYLLLVPTYVRRRDVNANIGFFMHSPFPSSDIYKMFPYRGEVLKSLLFCDLIGFHLFEYARNFYTSCRRILGLNHEFKKGGFLGIESFGRTVMLRISHIGIQIDDILEMMESDQYQQFAKYLTQTIRKRHIISSIDRFHPISGLKNKLLAYQKFLRDYPVFRQHACLVQYVVPTDCPKCQLQECSHQMIDQTRSEIVNLIKEIEEEFGKGVIQYLEQDLTMEQRLALWSVTTILLITTLRDGQCLPPLEFITVKKHLNKTNRSAVILSEFSGCNRALGGILKINPFNVDEIAKTIDTAINMTSEEKEQRFKIAFNYISKHSTLKWAEAFLKDLKRSHQPCESVSRYMVIGFGLNQTLIKTRQGFQELKLQYLENQYENSTNRLVIIDQEGVLPMRGAPNRNQEPLPHVVRALNDISRDERNTVFIISSQTKDLLHKWYATAAPYLGLAAENGFFWRMESLQKNEHQWIKLLKLLDFCWIESVKDIMLSYTEKTDGAFIEEKESMIVWNYKDTDPDFGNWQAKELTSHLEHVFINLPIEIVHGKKCLEVIPNQLKKQKLVKLLLESIAKKLPIDFILYIGDDSGNEPVFTYLNNKRQQNSKFLKQGANVYTCTIGRKATQAKYYLTDPDQVVHLLESLQGASIKQKRTKSFADLNRQGAITGPRQHQYFNSQAQRQGSELIKKGPIQSQSQATFFGKTTMRNDSLPANQGTPQKGTSGIYNQIDSDKDEDSEGVENKFNDMSQDESDDDDIFGYNQSQTKNQFK